MEVYPTPCDGCVMVHNPMRIFDVNYSRTGACLHCFAKKTQCLYTRPSQKAAVRSTLDQLAGAAGQAGPSAKSAGGVMTGTMADPTWSL